MASSSVFSFRVVLYLLGTILLSIYIGSVNALPYDRTLNNDTAYTTSRYAPSINAISLPHLARSSVFDSSHKAIYQRADTSTTDTPPKEPPPLKSPFGHQSHDPKHPTGKSDNIDDQPKPTRVEDSHIVQGARFKHHMEVPLTYCELTFAAKKAYGEKYLINIFDHKLLYEGTENTAAVDKYGNPQDPKADCTDQGVCYDKPPVRKTDSSPVQDAAPAYHWLLPASYAQMSFKSKQAYGIYYNISIFDTTLRYVNGEGAMAAVDDKGDVQNPDCVYDERGVYRGLLDDPLDRPRSEKEMRDWRTMWGNRTNGWQQLGDEERTEKMEKGKEKVEKWWKGYCSQNRC